MTAPGDIGADRTAELNQLIAEAKDGLQLDADVWYRCDASVEIFDKPGFILDLNGATIWRAVHPTTPRVMSVHGRNSAFAIRNGHILGHKLPQAGYVRAVEGHHGLGVFACPRVEAVNVTIEHVPGDFVYVMSMGHRKPHDNLTPCGTVVLDGLECHDAGRHAVSALAVVNLDYSGSRFYGWREKKIDIEQGGPYKTLESALHDLGGNVWEKHAA